MSLVNWNCYLSLCYGATGWETAHLEVRKAICNHIAETNTYTGIRGSRYLADTKMSSLMTQDMDVELMAAAQVLGINIYVYHKCRKEYKLHSIPCGTLFFAGNCLKQFLCNLSAISSYMGWYVILCWTLFFAENCLKQILMHLEWLFILCRMPCHPTWNFIFLLEVVWDKFQCIHSCMSSYKGWHVILHGTLFYAGNCLKQILIHSKWHVILHGTLCFVGNWLKKISMYSKWRVILQRMACHPMWNFNFCWKLAKILNHL